MIRTHLAGGSVGYLIVKQYTNPAVISCNPAPTHPHTHTPIHQAAIKLHIGTMLNSSVSVPPPPPLLHIHPDHGSAQTHRSQGCFSWGRAADADAGGRELREHNTLCCCYALANDGFIQTQGNRRAGRRGPGVRSTACPRMLRSTCAFPLPSIPNALRQIEF